MARKSVVVEPPKPRRQSVVARPPTQRRDQRASDVVFGILGLLLLVGAIALIPYLTQDPPPKPQFQVDFEEHELDLPTQTADFTEDETKEFTYEADFQNITAVQLRVGFTDDVPSSEPDRFRVELVDPNGDLAIDGLVITNEPGELISGSTPPQYRGVHMDQPLAATPVDRPAPQVITADRVDATADDIAAQVAEEFSVGGRGTWTVRVSLIEVGGCPDSPDFDPENPEEAEPQRFIACQEGGGEDTGNDFSVSQFKFIYYEGTVSEQQG